MHLIGLLRCGNLACMQNILPCSACAGPANGDGSGESRLHGEERGGDVGKKT